MTSTGSSSRSSRATPPVPPLPSPKLLLRALKEAGFPDSDIFLGGASPKKFNLVARYHGTGAQKPLLLLAHTRRS